MNAFVKNWGLVIQDWYFVEGMDSNSAGEKDKKERKDYFFEKYVYTQ